MGGRWAPMGPDYAREKAGRHTPHDADPIPVGPARELTRPGRTRPPATPQPHPPAKRIDVFDLPELL